MKSMETDTVSTGQFVIYFLVQVFLEAVGVYLLIFVALWCFSLNRIIE